MKNNKGITLIALVITIIILMILAGVSINLILGQEGVINKAKYAASETEKQTAKESMNLKITQIQIEKYTEARRMPTLQELADKLCEDEDIQYVTLESKKVASLEKIEVGEATSIYTKIKQFPYEFEINSSLQLASIDGVKIAQNTENDEQIKNLAESITNLEDRIESLEQIVTVLQNDSETTLIEKTWGESSITVPANTWTELETVSFSNYGTGKAIISYSASTAGTSSKIFQIDMFKNNEIIGSDGTSQLSSETSWLRGSTTKTISYDENTVIKFRAWTSTDLKPSYAYSIMIIPD